MKKFLKWIFRQIEKSGEAINAADDRIIASMYGDKDERKEK
jgi:hypothetical protein